MRGAPAASSASPSSAAALPHLPIGSIERLSPIVNGFAVICPLRGEQGEKNAIGSFFIYSLDTIEIYCEQFAIGIAKR